MGVQKLVHTSFRKIEIILERPALRLEQYSFKYKESKVIIDIQTKYAIREILNFRFKFLYKLI